MGQLEDMSASLAATKATVDKTKASVDKMSSDMQETLKAILKATKEQTAGVDKFASTLRKEIVKQNAELRKDVLKQNADNAVLMLKQTAALVAAVQEQTKAIEKLAAPARESGKRKRVEGPAADAGNQQETSATDSQTSAAEKLLSSSLKGKGPADAGEGTSAARRKKKMKDPAPAPAPAKEVLSVNATSPLEGTCTWTISNFSSLEVDKWGSKYSDTFIIGSHKWELRLYPRGLGKKKGKSLAAFLHLAEDTSKLPKDGKVTVDFWLSVNNQRDRNNRHKGEANYEFNAKDKNQGWRNFMSLPVFHDAANGFLVNDTVIIEAKIEVLAPTGVVSVNAASPLEGTCTWTIPNFSKLKVNEWGRKYSDTFSIGGHKWELSLYPKGRDSARDKSVSLFLEIADDTNKLPKGWQVTVASTFFVKCQHNPHESHKEGGVDVFDAVHKSWGWNELIPLDDFHDAAKGFLVNDTVIIEATVAVNAPAKEVVSVNAASPTEGICTWTIPNFSKLKLDAKGRKISDTFSIGGHKWFLSVFPRGDGSEKDKSVSLFLWLADNTDKLPKDGKVTADYSLSVICQHDPEKSRKRESYYEFKHKGNNRGFTNLISLTDFHDAANGFLVNDTVIFEAKIEVKEAAPGVLSVNATGPHEGTCTWMIPNFSKLKVGYRVGKFSDLFSIGGHKWKLKVYPKGNGSEKDKSVSFFLYLADAAHKLPKDGKVTAASTFSVVCQHDPEKSRKKGSDKPDIYNPKARSWGFENFIPLTDFHDAANGFLVNDTVTFEAKIEVKKPAKTS